MTTNTHNVSSLALTQIERSSIMQERKYIILSFLAGLSATVSVAGLIIAGKPHQVIPGAEIPTSMWLFPLIFVFGSIVTEIYGARIARWVTWATFTCTAVAVLYFALTVYVPYPDYWRNQDAYRLVLMTTPRIMVASVTAYFVASYTNIGVLVAVKKLTQGRWLWLRILLAALASQVVDSVLFVGISFLGIIPAEAIWPMIATSAVLKFCMQLAGIPVSYGVVRLVKERIE